MALNEKDILSGGYQINNNSPDSTMGTNSTGLGRKVHSGSNVDSEKGTTLGAADGTGKGMRRIAPVLPHLRGYEAGIDDSDGDAMLGKQLEAEADNAIQYRTCSWQKVCLFFPPLFVYIDIGVSHCFRL